MSGAIGKGDFVEAVISGGTAPWTISQGTIYRVCRVIVAPVGRACGRCGAADGGIELAEIPPHPDHIWCVCAFKPISGGHPGMFDELLKAPTDAPSKEPVAA